MPFQYEGWNRNKNCHKHSLRSCTNRKRYGCSEFKGFKRWSVMQAWFSWLCFLSKSSWVWVSFGKFKLCCKYYWLVLDWSVINFVHARKMVLYLRVCPWTFVSLLTVNTEKNILSPTEENNENRDLSLFIKKSLFFSPLAVLRTQI